MLFQQRAEPSTKGTDNLQNQRTATFFALVAVLLWSTVATAFKLSLRYLDTFQLLAWASFSATLILVVWMGARGRLAELWPRFRQQPQWFITLGLLNPLFYYLVLFEAYDLLPAQQAQTINYSWAITLGLLSIPLLKRAYGARDALGSVLAYAGVLVIATRGDPLSLQFDSPLGVALALFSTLIWAVYWIVNTRLDTDPLLSLCLCFLCGLPFTLAACALFSNLVPGDWYGLLGAVYVGFFEMGITFVIWLAAMKTAVNVARISNLIFLAPFVSLVLISVVLDEQIVPATLAGMVLVLTGTLVQQFRRRS